MWVCERDSGLYVNKARISQSLICFGGVSAVWFYFGGRVFSSLVVHSVLCHARDLVCSGSHFCSSTCAKAQQSLSLLAPSALPADSYQMHLYIKYSLALSQGGKCVNKTVNAKTERGIPF